MLPWITKHTSFLSFRTSEARRNPLKVASSGNINVFTDKGIPFRRLADRNDKKTVFCNSNYIYAVKNNH